jgi:hypothetical protein
MDPKKIWISGLVPANGADIYNGIRLAVSDSEREALADLVDWTLNNIDEKAPDVDDAPLEDLRAYLNDSDEIKSWNVEERTI